MWYYVFEIDEKNNRLLRRLRIQEDLQVVKSTLENQEVILVYQDSVPLLIQSEHKYLGEDNCIWDSTNKRVSFQGYVSNDAILKNGLVDYLVSSNFDRTMEFGLLRKAVAELYSALLNKTVLNNSENHIQEFLDYYNNLETEKNRLKINLSSDQNSAGDDLEIISCTIAYSFQDKRSFQVVYSSSEFSPEIKEITF